MTKVLRVSRNLWSTAFWLVCFLPLAAAAIDAPEKPAESLYLQLGQVGMNPSQVYRVRDASLTRSAIQISLEDGTIAFTQDVMGRITGAFFEGDGEILLTPPNEVERRSMSLFTGMAILEERFASAYFRFNDDVAGELRPDLRVAEDKQEFIDKWASTMKNLAGTDATRLLLSFSHMLPSNGTAGGDEASSPSDRFLHARLQGTKLGVFDVFFDSTIIEQIQVGQARASDDGETFYDVWASFTSNPAFGSQASTGDKDRGGRIAIRRYAIKTDVQLPKQIHSRAEVDCEVKEGGPRAVLFELSRFLQIDSVKLDGRPVEFIHNPAIEGTELSRRGNDVVAIIMPHPLQAGERFKLDFEYGGEVLAEAGSGLVYVGEHGTWYPNRGMEMADFDLTFTYPQGWTLVATGKPAQAAVDSAQKTDVQISRWISDRPIPLAGFNLGKYKEATTRAGNVDVETYAAQGVEKDFPNPQIQVLDPLRTGPKHTTRVEIPSRPAPSQTQGSVGESAARAIQYFAERFGPFPYSHLALTQMPGRESQGWPGLVFLSTYAFLDQQQREQLHYDHFRSLLQQSVPVHETAHQWWGDLITWSSYRDQWFSEGLASYCSLMMLQEKNPTGFREIMEQYRSDLTVKNKDGIAPMDAGPVTLGTRLLSSRFPLGYEAITYGRGTWLFHMLRTMMKDAEQQSGRKSAGTEEPFVRALRKARQRYEGRAISTRELIDVFVEELPPSLRYEGKNSLDWFVDGWINGVSLPKLELKSVKVTPKGASASVSGTILQKDAPEDLVTSVPIYAVLAGRQQVLIGRVFADGNETTFHLTTPVGTQKVVLDPNETILTSPK